MQKAYQINNESGHRSKGRFGAIWTTVSVVFAARKPLKIDCSIEGSTYQLPSLSEVQVISHRTHTHTCTHTLALANKHRRTSILMRLATAEKQQ